MLALAGQTTRKFGLDETGKIVTCNAAGLRILRAGTAMLERPAQEFFAGPNAWILEKLEKVGETQQLELTMDAEMEFSGERCSMNVTVMPLISVEQKRLGSMIMIEDISSEKRMKSTMSRYMDPAIADRLLAAGSEVLGGRSVCATVLFADIRSFTTLSEELGPLATVSMLNEYFELMVACIQKEGGMLDKFIGDAIMAAFGVSVTHDDDEDRAVRASIAMIRVLKSWNVARVAEGKKPVNIGIGLNTDMVVSGNIGSPKRMDYTVIGDGVNLAARLQTAVVPIVARTGEGLDQLREAMTAALGAPRLGIGEADVILGCDLVVSASTDARDNIARRRTKPGGAANNRAKSTDSATRQTARQSTS